MSRKSKEICIHILHIDRHMRRALCAVHNDYRIFLMCHCSNILHRILMSQYIRYLCDSNNFRFLRDLLAHFIQIQRTVRAAFHKAQRRTSLSCNHLPREQIAVMFHNGHKNLIACLHVIQPITVCYQIDTFGRISCENNFTRRFCTNKITYCFAGILVQICRFHAERIISAQWICIMLCIKICLCIYDALWTL